MKKISLWRWLKMLNIVNIWVKLCKNLWLQSITMDVFKKNKSFKLDIHEVVSVAYSTYIFVANKSTCRHRALNKCLAILIRMKDLTIYIKFMTVDLHMSQKFMRETSCQKPVLELAKYCFCLLLLIKIIIKKR